MAVEKTGVRPTGQALVTEIVYVPFSVGTDKAVQLGAAWLREQQGEKLVLVPQMQVYRNNDLLPRLTAGVTAAKPSTVWQTKWRGSPVLAPWPTGDVLAWISESGYLSGVTTSISGRGCGPMAARIW